MLVASWSVLTEEMDDCVDEAFARPVAVRVAWLLAAALTEPMCTTNVSHWLSAPVAELDRLAIELATSPFAPPDPGVDAAIPVASVGMTLRPSAAGFAGSTVKKLSPVVPAEFDPVCMIELTEVATVAVGLFTNPMLSGAAAAPASELDPVAAMALTVVPETSALPPSRMS